MTNKSGKSLKENRAAKRTKTARISATEALPHADKRRGATSRSPAVRTALTSCGIGHTTYQDVWTSNQTKGAGIFPPAPFVGLFVLRLTWMDLNYIHLKREKLV